MSVVVENSGQTRTGKAQQTRRVLVFASTFPSQVQPIHGVFVKERVRFVAQLPDVDVRVISPVPYFPPIRRFKRWYPLSQIPRAESIDGLSVERPRYFLPPKIGAMAHAHLMYLGARRAVRRSQREFDCDLIDAHFVYPDGVAATMFARRMNKPVVLTGRGEEILRFPDLPVIGRAIRWALPRATRLIALSVEIAESMERCGADPARITVIENGVDGQKFHPVPQREAQRKMQLPTDRPIVVSAGYRLERKGFHILIDAIPQIRQRIPNVLVVIVGGPARWGEDYTPVIEARIQANNVQDHVRLIGARPQEELSYWYSAGDVFALLTSREGSPNVLMESLACGTPAVATPIGGIPEVLSDSRLGVLLTERTAAEAARGIIQALRQTWDRPAIREAAEARSWSRTAERVNEVFTAAIEEYRARPGQR
jgi:teichuronic acid biosynthesis glycosyltransferase TuaC